MTWLFSWQPYLLWQEWYSRAVEPWSAIFVTFCWKCVPMEVCCWVKWLQIGLCTVSMLFIFLRLMNIPNMYCCKMFHFHKCFFLPFKYRSKHGTNKTGMHLINATDNPWYVIRTSAHQLITSKNKQPNNEKPIVLIIVTSFTFMH